MTKSQLRFGFLALALFLGLRLGAESKCHRGCELALASYYLWRGTNLTFISAALSTTIPLILSFNPQIANRDYILAGSRANVPFPCDCIDGEYLAHRFVVSARPGATYGKIAGTYLSNLTTAEELMRVNSYGADFVADEDARFNATVNCSCGDDKVSKEYGLFVSYPLRRTENLLSVAASSGFPLELLQRYNPNVASNAGGGLIFIPGKDQTGYYPPLKSRTGISHGIIAGISVAMVAGALVLVLLLYVRLYKRKVKAKSSFHKPSENQFSQHRHGYGDDLVNASDAAAFDGNSQTLTGFSVNKSIEYSYEELSKATNDFNAANKIGQGGFGAVYYAELRGEVAAVKKMDMKSSKQFLAELMVLTNVHHWNLVHLIGYCTEGSLFLVYEFIENGNLSQHLRGKGREALPWRTRVQIALDSARGLEYIHEHTVPVYIHRDVKSANILIDKNFRAKVADFGLTKLSEIGGGSLKTQLVGTFGYMPPEYARFGSASAKVDVYAFGVVLYELISGKEAIIRVAESATSTTGLVGLFDEAFSKPGWAEEIHKLVDPRIGSYPLDLVLKMAQLGRACTHENPQLRPTMRSVVVALTTLLSSTEDWDATALRGNQDLLNLASGR